MQRALTIKILTIGFLALIMLIPLAMIQGKISERDLYRAEATYSVAQSWTGEQTIMTPVLVIPYIEIIEHVKKIPDGTVTTQTGNTTHERSIYREQTTQESVTRYRFVQPDQAAISGKINTNILMRGIFPIPVYESELLLEGVFSREKIESALEEVSELQDEPGDQDAFVALNISDVRGINNVPILRWGDQNLSFEPGTNIPKRSRGIHAGLSVFDLTESDIEFRLDLNLRGMENLSFIPAGDLVDIDIQSTWPHPEFIGAFLPEHREITNEGFSANWQVTQFASNISAKIADCGRGDCASLSNTSLGVNLIDPVDIYMQSERSVKYGILFIGLSFISFFLFEHIKKMRIHPIQYGLVGLSIATFYLLLISLSEHINFGLSYMIATLACVGLIFSYLKIVLAGVANSLWFCIALFTLYAILYVIIQAEDFALLMGAVLVFGALSMVMRITRRINWYQIGEQLTQHRDGQKEMKI